MGNTLRCSWEDGLGTSPIGEQCGECSPEFAKRCPALNKDKQIEEMAKDLQETHDYEGCEAWHCDGCEYEKYGKGHFCSSIKQAEKMTAKGYRKSEDVAREIFEEIDRMIYKVLNDKHYIMGDMCYEVAELKKKYESEKDNG